MFRARKDQDLVEQLQARVAHLEGLNAALTQYMSNRGNIIRSLRDTLPAGTVERGIADLLLTLEREAYAKVFANEVGDQQQTGHEAFVSVMSRALRS